MPDASKTDPRRSFKDAMLAAVVRALNPRYQHFPVEKFDEFHRILDVGGEPADAIIAKRLFRTVAIEAVNIKKPLEEIAGYKLFEKYHVADLDKSDLTFLANERFDYVISSHLIEHLGHGEKIVSEMCDKIRPGGHLYLEWPSIESKHFPIRGVGLNFYDDGTHVDTFPLERIEKIIRGKGLEILRAGKRRHPLRMLLAPVLVPYRCIRNRTFVLYDLWDFTGFCYVIEAVKPIRPSPERKP